MMRRRDIRANRRSREEARWAAFSPVDYDDQPRDRDRDTEQRRDNKPEDDYEQRQMLQ